MKGRIGFRILMALFSLTFICALLSGAGRLLGGREPQQPDVPPALSTLSAVIPRDAEQSTAPSEQEAVRRVPQAAALQERDAGVVCAQTDANGNVLRGESYLRTVYRAFALGDGFA